MKKQDLYFKTVDLLLDAYNERRLIHGECDACAVGNICGGSSVWAARFFTQGKEQVINHTHFVGTDDDFELAVHQVGGFLGGHENAMIKLRELADEVISKSGYTQEELMKIEYAFEVSIIDFRYSYDVSDAKKQFIGLCSVLDVLKEIHEVDTLDHESSSKRLKNVYEALSV